MSRNLYNGALETESPDGLKRITIPYLGRSSLLLLTEEHDGDKYKKRIGHKRMLC